MKKLILFSIIQILIINVSFSQSTFSILGKSGGQLLQDLGKKKEWRAIGKAIETASDRTYEMEKIAQQNKEELTIIKKPDETERIYPKEGYKWENSKDRNDYRVVKITEMDIASYSSATELLIISIEFTENADWYSAIQYVNQSLDMEETYEAYLFRSTIYMMQGFHTKALEDLGSALNFELNNDQYRELYKLKTNILLQSQDYKRTIDACNFCITKLNYSDESLSDIYSNRANAKLNTSQIASAYEDACKSVVLNQQNPVAFLTRGTILAEGYNKLQLAINEFNIAIDILNVNHDKNELTQMLLALAYQSRSFAYFKLGTYNESLKDANLSVKCNSSNGFGYLLRGVAKFKLGFQEGAELDFKRAKDLAKISDQQIEELLKQNN